MSGVTPESGVWSLQSLRSLESGVWGHSPETGVTPLESGGSGVTGVTPESGVWSHSGGCSLESGVWSHSGVWSLPVLSHGVWSQESAVTP